MTLSHPRQLIRFALSGALLLAFCIGLLRWPEAAAAAAKSGLLLCGDLIIPSLFPFFILSTLTVSLGFSSLLGRLLEPMMQPLFHQSGAGASALVLGFIGGYPVGAKTVCTLYQEQLCSREQAQCLLAFCNNSGPAFIVGAAGIAVFQSAKIGFVLMAIQILSALLVGLLFRPPKSVPAPHHPVSTPRQSIAKCVTGSVGQSTTATLNICAYVILFNVIIQLLASCGFLDFCEMLLARSHCPGIWQKGLLAGLLELSNGISALSNTPSAIIPAAFLLSWGRPVRTLPDPLPASGKRFEHSLLPVGQALAGLSLCRPGLSLFTALSCRVDHGSADWNLGSGPCLAPHCRTLFRSYLDCAKRRTAGRRNRRQQKKHWKTTIKVCIMVISFTVPAGERKGEDHYAVPQRY